VDGEAWVGAINTQSARIAVRNGFAPEGVVVTVLMKKEYMKLR
jgi:hypothetical protein